MGAPFYIVFAGVNGAGKTTFFTSNLWRTADMPMRMERVNPDELLRSQGGNWRSTKDNLAAGKEALRRIDGLFAIRRSFNQETTLAGRTALSNIQRANELGYRVFLYYIGVDSPQTALARIEHRVELGGHDIDEDAVLRRYNASLSALAHALDYCEQAMVFDNTVDFRCLGLWSNGTLAWWGAKASEGNWLADVITNDALWQR